VTLRSRYLVILPFAILLLATLVGGVINSVDARGRVVDDITGKGIPDATITHGIRTAQTDADGGYVITALPRTSIMQIDKLGYFRMRASTTQTEVRLTPTAVTIYAYDATKTEADRIPLPQARDVENTKIIANGNESGQIVVAPHPGKDAKLKICAEGFEPKDITVEGVLMQIGLQPGGTGCPPLPNATPTPTGSPEGSPAATPSPEPTPTPAPTSTP